MMTLKITKNIKLTIKNGNDITTMKESIIIDQLNENKIENCCVISNSAKKNFASSRYFFIIFTSMLLTIHSFIIYYLLNFNNL